MKFVLVKRTVGPRDPRFYHINYVIYSVGVVDKLMLEYIFIFMYCTKKMRIVYSN